MSSGYLSQYAFEPTPQGADRAVRSAHTAIALARVAIAEGFGEERAAQDLERGIGAGHDALRGAG